MSGDGREPASVAEPHYDWDGFGFDTRQVHAGELPEPGFGSRITPIHLSNAFRFDSFDQTHGRFAGTDEGQLYSRHLNPTNVVAERRIASLEGGTGAVVVGSGTAAISSALIALVEAGDHFVSTASIYSGTQILFNRALKRLGITVGYVWDPDDEAEWEAAIRPETKAIFTETIPNPKNDIVDIEQVARIAARHGLPLVVDNTVATPYLIRPLELGASIVVHSSTKFLGGHGAGISGVIVDGGTFDWRASGRRYPLLTDEQVPGAPSFLDRLGDEHAFEAYLRLTVVNDLGPALSPFNGFLLQQGIETLSLRLERHLDNARTIALWLAAQPEVESVDFAGLPGHPQHELAERLYGGRTGSVFAFTVAGGLVGARVFIDRLQVFSRMTNIGDVRSMAIHPGTTTHLSFDAEKTQRLGITPGLIRLSVGIETVDDLITDLGNGLRAVRDAGLVPHLSLETTAPGGH
ncbi:O-acetylhomoserine aminocarboxypropyltransferase/cysteine synthase family protein [Herbiconiux daphne]|uniref:Aminotransferase class I/II-fold pyridoxal phosphate-dependent enzyme n=1 Tax=Herbiconiux daphne TaxID=2970914 RepID=A0ABT2H8P6_9MICO|nr:aminotransferase class I/II-fold pyridoxal phosphate-dependent enzyme [Herbiconiux daphne]MCS5736303.1 aminotransferase class I/II-fold pyridoxal phosphate-dependent enzyme [Herbiconiux daphne]